MTKDNRRYVLFLLTSLFAVAHLDRHVLSISLNAIGQEFSLSNTQLGMLSGLVFAVMFVLAGFPIAHLAARGNRRNIVAASAVVWSALTLAMALAQNFTQLVLARLGVGLGEAGAVAPAHAIISDHYPEGQRTSALATFATGANIGVLLAFLIGGVVGQAFGWRWAFVVAGVPGLVLAVLLRFTARDAARPDSPPPVAHHLFRRTVLAIWQDRGLFHACCGIALTGIVTFGALAWLPTFLIRSHGLGLSQVGLFLALTTGIVGGLGTYATGQLADRLGQQRPRWRIGLVILAILLTKPLSWVFLLSDNTMLALACFVLVASVANVFWGPTFAYLHDRLPPEMRPMGTAVFLFAFNLIGVGIGPTLVGLASDTVYAGHGQDSLRLALATVHVFGLWGLWHYWQAMMQISAVPQVSGLPAR